MSTPDFYSVIKGKKEESPESSSKSSETPDFYSLAKSKSKSYSNNPARLAAQFAIGRAENLAISYELAVAGEKSKHKQLAAYRENLFSDIERLLEQKQTGVWDKQDEELLNNLTEQAKDPSKSEQFLRTSDIGVGNLIEKGAEQFGVDLKPQGAGEHLARIGGNFVGPKALAKGVRSLPSKFSKDAREAKKWERLSKAYDKDPAKSSMLDFAVENNLTPEQATLLLQNPDIIKTGGKIAKKTKNFKENISEIQKKLSGKYNELKDIADSGGYLNTQEKIPLVRSLENIVNKAKDPLGVGPETQKAISVIEDTLNNVKGSEFSLANLINKRQALKQGKLGINWNDVSHGDVLKKELDTVLFDHIKKMNPRVGTELKKTDKAWSQYKRYQDILDKKQPSFKFKGMDLEGLPSGLAFGVTVGLVSHNPLLAAKAVLLKEGIQRLSTKLLMDPKFQQLHTRLVDAVVSGAKNNQRGIITSILKMLKKDDPDLYDELKDLEIE